MSDFFSIVICSNKKSDWLFQLLESLNTSFSYCFYKAEVLLVNNSDEPSKLVGDECSAFESLVIQEVRSRANSLSAARNTALRESAATWICFLDDDELVDTNYGSVVLDVLKEITPLTVVQGRVLLQDSQRLTHEAGVLTSTLLCNVDYGDTAKKISSGVVGANMILHRERALEIGGFSEQLGRMGRLLLSNEDVEFAQRHVKSGGEILYVPSLVSHHRFIEGRAKRNWILERMAWQGVSDNVMGSKTSESELRIFMAERGYDGLHSEIGRLMEPGSAIQFEDRAEIIRHLVNFLLSLSTEANLENNLLFQASEAVKYPEIESDCETLFIDFEGNHLANYEYVFRATPKSSRIIIPANPWINPSLTALELQRFIYSTKFLPKNIVFLTLDPILWSHRLFESSIKRLSSNSKLVGYIHRTNKEIQQGALRLHKFFSDFIMFGYAGANFFTGKTGLRIVSSPIISFYQSYFKNTLTSRDIDPSQITFGIVGEFRHEKKFRYFLTVIEALARKHNSIEIKLFGNDLDGSKEMFMGLLTKLPLQISNLDLKGFENLHDRIFFEVLSSVDVVVSPYSKSDKIPASGLVSEAIAMGKKVLIQEGSWLYSDVRNYARDSIYNGEALYSNNIGDEQVLVSNQRALKILWNVLNESDV